MAQYLEDIRQGNSFDTKIEYGVDVTGWQFALTLSLTLNQAVPDFTKIVTAGDNALDDVIAGDVFIHVSAEECDGIAAGKYYYAVKRWDVSSPPKELTLVPPTADYKDRVIVVPRVTAT